MIYKILSEKILLSKWSKDGVVGEVMKFRGDENINEEKLAAGLGMKLPSMKFLLPY